MNFTVNGPSVALVIFGEACSVLVTIFWMYVAWRAMRAHERLANAAVVMSRSDVRKPLPRASDGPIHHE